MTDLQKEQILSMRNTRESYAAIATALGLSRNTVKSYCQRNICTENTPTITPSICDMCGKPIDQIPGYRKRRFCSDACRMAWWNTHRNLISGQTKVAYTCTACGIHFSDYPKHKRKYCSHACYIDHRYGADRYE